MSSLPLPIGNTSWVEYQAYQLKDIDIDNLVKKVLGIFFGDPWRSSLSASACILVLTYAMSLASFTWTRWSSKGGKSVPTLPYLFPGICHGFGLEWSMADFLSKSIRSWGYLAPMKVAAGSFGFVMVTNPQHIRKMLRSSRILTNRPMMVFVMMKWFYAPPESMHHYTAHEDSNREDEHIHDQQAGISIKFLSGQHLQGMSERYMSTLQKRLDALPLEGEGQWLEIPDFYTWLRDQVTPTSIEAMFGSRLVEMYPDISTDFWKFDDNIANFSRNLPRWLIPNAYKNRDKLLANIKKWNILAHANTDCRKHGLEDPEWDEHMGSRFIKAREDIMKQHGLDDETVASENLGVLFGANANAVRAVFWCIFEALKDPDLKDRLHAELMDCRMSGSSPTATTTTTTTTGQQPFDLSKFATKPLLQSTYAELLRMLVQTTFTRTNENGDFDLGPDYTVRQNETMTVFSSITAHNTEAWRAARPEALAKPLDVFWPERFLVRKSKDAASQPTFSLEGLTECWMPYGGGQRMCPGRHFAKLEIIGTLGVLLDNFEMELMDRNRAGKVIPDKRWVPYGTLPPKGLVSVRLRRLQKQSVL
ncbi:Putative cytochrome P450 [Colletotrichum destructivum]|uniref:Cytochrome P450 n=1 Tax=Colletotrichum destructivum TaxID=34406 RepID=A0AAX4J4E0_9PEZI|nr:Putative cytochrome P450 [Colletotrichum destructivum]